MRVSPKTKLRTALTADENQVARPLKSRNAVQTSSAGSSKRVLVRLGHARLPSRSLRAHAASDTERRWPTEPRHRPCVKGLLTLLRGRRPASPQA
jgi:hypothetical protein